MRKKLRFIWKIKKNQGKHLIIKTDKDSQEFLRYCIMRYYKKCALIMLKEGRRVCTEDGTSV